MNDEQMLMFEYAYIIHIYLHTYINRGIQGEHLEYFIAFYLWIFHRLVKWQWKIRSVIGNIKNQAPNLVLCLETLMNIQRQC